MPSATALQLSPADQADQQAEDALYYRRVLHELIDLGTDLARTVHQQATAQAGAAEEADGPAAMPPHEAAVAFDRLARAVRRTVALARKVAEPLPQHADGGSEQKHAAARRRILREVEDAIQREAESADVDTLEAELRERLDGPELDDEIDHRPVAEVIADICRDLGLLTLLGNHPWKRRTPQDVAALCARAAQPSGSRPSADQACADQACADPPQALLPSAAPAAAGRFRTWAGPKPYSREASMELMHQLLQLRPPIRGP